MSRARWTFTVLLLHFSLVNAARAEPGVKKGSRTFVHTSSLGCSGCHKKVSDRRIPPLASVVEKYPLSGGAREPLRVKVKLLYRSVPPWGLAEAGVSVEEVKVPVLVMAEAEKTFR